MISRWVPKTCGAEKPRTRSGAPEMVPVAPTRISRRMKKIDDGGGDGGGDGDPKDDDDDEAVEAAAAWVVALWYRLTRVSLLSDLLKVKFTLILRLKGDVQKKRTAVEAHNVAKDEHGLQDTSTHFEKET